MIYICGVSQLSTFGVCHSDLHLGCASMIYIWGVRQWSTFGVCFSDVHLGCVSMIYIWDVSQWSTYGVCHSDLHLRCVSMTYIWDVSQWPTLGMCHILVFPWCYETLMWPRLSFFRDTWREDKYLHHTQSQAFISFFFVYFDNEWKVHLGVSTKWMTITMNLNILLLIIIVHWLCYMMSLNVGCPEIILPGKFKYELFKMFSFSMKI